MNQILKTELQKLSDWIEAGPTRMLSTKEIVKIQKHRVKPKGQKIICHVNNKPQK